MQKWKRYTPEIAFAALSLFIGGIGGLLTRIGMPAYEMTVKPWFTPPAWVFPVVWTALYILMGVGMGRVWKTHSPRLPQCLWFFGAQLMLNLFWTLWFFVLRLYDISFGWLLILLGAVLAMTACFRKADPLAAKLQIPYVLWLVLAAALNYGVWKLN